MFGVCKHAILFLPFVDICRSYGQSPTDRPTLCSSIVDSPEPVIAPYQTTHLRFRDIRFSRGVWAWFRCQMAWLLQLENWVLASDDPR